MAADAAALALSLGFDDARLISGDQLVLDRRFRAQCEANACGLYGRCWMCPPDAGDIDALMAQARAYPCALLYQSVHPLEDSFDFEGMQAAGLRHSAMSRQLGDLLSKAGYRGFLHLSKGGCGLCSPCAKAAGEPCRFPEKALPSLEAYGVNVSATAKNAAMRYTNGADTVTYFGLVLMKENLPCPD